MKQGTLKLIIALVFGLALLAGAGYLIMKKVEEWYIMQAKKEVVTGVAEKAQGFLGRFGGDK